MVSVTRGYCVLPDAAVRIVVLTAAAHFHYMQHVSTQISWTFWVCDEVLVRS